MKPLFDIPSIRDYFMDLDYILGVISDGPSKSFAFRRLKYLRNKWSMFTLLYELQELAEMKVSEICSVNVSLLPQYNTDTSERSAPVSRH